MLFKRFVCFDEEGNIKFVCKERLCENPICDEYIIKLIKIDRDQCNINSGLEELRKTASETSQVLKELTDNIRRIR